ncbi:MAG: hypothetical protein E6Q97_26325 [Desulfurellales bacterium]|nr:MAG: hypothetical protein E6Q97_26325 [Desulfurellales bacterium]
MASFGGQTVSFVSVSYTGERGYLGAKATTRSETVVAGCHFRPAATTEVDGQKNVATEIWKCTAPPVDAVLNAQPGDELSVGGVTFHIDGTVQPKYDLAGAVSHVTIMCKRQRG